jgi:molybdate transport system substrate-binding protein
MRMSLRLLLAAMFACSIFPRAARAQSENEITVSAAISLKDSFEEIGRAYEAKHGMKILFNFGGSGALKQQIIQGAPVDAFAPASPQDMDELSRQGCIDTSTIARVASNSLVLIAPSNAPQSFSSFAGLGSPAVKRIALGNPKTVPAGRYAEEVFAYYGLSAAIRAKFIYTENVRQALDYAARGEVDAGIVYATDAQARSGDIRTIARAPDASHSPIVYPIAVVRGSRHGAGARAFIRFVCSDDAKKILRKHGFTTDK